MLEQDFPKPHAYLYPSVGCSPWLLASSWQKGGSSVKPGD